MANELRAHPRTRLSLPVTLTVHGREVASAVTLDVARGGALLLLGDGQPLPEGQVEAEFTDVDGRVLVRAPVRVVRTTRHALPSGDDSPGLAVEFLGQPALSLAFESILRSSAHQRAARALLTGTDPMAHALELQKTQGIVLPRLSQELLAAFAPVGCRRGAFIWQWVQRGLELTTLDTVAPELREQVMTLKWVGVMFTCLLDDTIDELKNEPLLEASLAITRERGELEPVPEGFTERERAWLALTRRTWRLVWEGARTLPRFEALRPLLEYDYLQVLNCMRYALLLERLPGAYNATEHGLYHPHNMHMMVHGTLDLMCSPRVDLRELGDLRTALWWAQRMGRIGNGVATWRRELAVGDFSSEVFALALDTGVLRADELRALPPEQLEQRVVDARLEEELLAEWSVLRERVLALEARVHTVDLQALMEGVEAFVRLHLGSRGRI